MTLTNLHSCISRDDSSNVRGRTLTQPQSSLQSRQQWLLAQLELQEQQQVDGHRGRRRSVASRHVQTGQSSSSRSVTRTQTRVAQVLQMDPLFLESTHSDADEHVDTTEQQQTGQVAPPSTKNRQKEEKEEEEEEEEDDGEARARVTRIRRPGQAWLELGDEGEQEEVPQEVGGLRQDQEERETSSRSRRAVPAPRQQLGQPQQGQMTGLQRKRKGHPDYNGPYSLNEVDVDGHQTKWLPRHLSPQGAERKANRRKRARNHRRSLSKL